MKRLVQLQSGIRHMAESKICFWLHFPSMHHLGLVNAIARAYDLHISVVFDGGLPPERINLGWTELEVLADANYSELQENERRELIDRLGSEAIHVFFGFHAYPGIFAAMRYCSATGRKFFVWMEPVVEEGWKYFFRYFIYRIHAKWFSSSLQGVFIIGTMGIPFLLRCGFPKKMIIPFCYPINTHRAVKCHDLGHENNFRVIFVGELIPLKRVDLLIAALSEVDVPNIEATIVGDGSKRKELEQLALTLGVESRIEFKGSKINSEILPLIQEHDLLVLPSKFDGWGFAVNAALSQGTPVLISDQCGSQDFVKDKLCGEVFLHASLTSLVDKLTVLATKGKQSPEMRNRLRDKVKKQMSTAVVAEFMIQNLLELEDLGSKPPAPWLR